MPEFCTNEEAANVYESRECNLSKYTICSFSESLLVASKAVASELLCWDYLGFGEFSNNNEATPSDLSTF